MVVGEGVRMTNATHLYPDLLNIVGLMVAESYAHIQNARTWPSLLPHSV